MLFMPSMSNSNNDTDVNINNNDNSEVSSLSFNVGGDYCGDGTSILPHQLGSALSLRAGEDGQHNTGQLAATAAAVATTPTASSAQKKSSLRSRWLMLALTCVVMIGSYYAYDIPSALHQQLKDYMPPSSNYETFFNLLYTAYSLPNVIMPLLGGNVVDRYGAPRCLAAFAILVSAGAILVSFGVAQKSWAVIWAGRFVFGLGAESLCVAQSTIVSHWFEGKEVALAMGVGLTVSRLGSIWNNFASPKIADSDARGRGIEAAFSVGAALTCCSLASAVVAVVVDGRATEMLLRRSVGGQGLPSLTAALLENEAGETPRVEGHEGGHLVPRIGIDGGRGSLLDGCDELQNERATQAACAAPVDPSSIRAFTPLFWLLTLSCFVVYGCVLSFNNVASGILLERNLFTASPDDHCGLEHPDQCTAGYLQPGTNRAFDANTGKACYVAPSQAPVLPSSVNHTSYDSERSTVWEEDNYAISSVSSENVDCGDSFWSEACTSDYCTKQKAATEHAGRIMSIPYFISALSSPALGHLVDKIGRRAQIAVAATTLLLAVHLTLALSVASPVGPMIGQGIAYSLYAAALWPSVPLTVPTQYTGTAFGVITSIQNIGLALFPLVIAGIYKASGGQYIPNVELFFVSCATVGVGVGVCMNKMDRRYGNKLNHVSREEGENEETVGHFREDGAEDFADLDDDEYFSPLLHSSE